MEISLCAIANAKNVKRSRFGDKFIERNLIGAVSLNTMNIFFLRIAIYVAFHDFVKYHEDFPCIIVLIVFISHSHI